MCLLVQPQMRFRLKWRWLGWHSQHDYLPHISLLEFPSWASLLQQHTTPLLLVVAAPVQCCLVLSRYSCNTEWKTTTAITAHKYIIQQLSIFLFVNIFCYINHGTFIHGSFKHAGMDRKNAISLEWATCTVQMMILGNKSVHFIRVLTCYFIKHIFKSVSTLFNYISVEKMSFFSVTVTKYIKVRGWWLLMWRMYTDTLMYVR